MAARRLPCLIVTRSCAPKPHIVLVATPIVGILRSAPLSPIGWVTPSLDSLALFATAGCMSVGALLCVNRSLKLAPATSWCRINIRWSLRAVMFGFAVFGDVPSMATIIGATIIIGAGLYIFLRERHLGREERVVSPPV